MDLDGLQGRAAGLRRQANAGADDSSQYPSEAHRDRREGGNIASLPAGPGVPHQGRPDQWRAAWRAYAVYLA